MATVDKSLADKLVSNNGYYFDDPRIVKIVEYTNAFSGEKAYGIVYPYDDPDMYRESEFVINPRLYWSP
jgi:hypothetical protein